jgi:Flp pilus assembly pilin Flp
MVRRLLDKLELVRREDGQTMSEYAVTLGVIVLGVVAALGFFAIAVEGNLNNVATKITSLVP